MATIYLVFSKEYGDGVAFDNISDAQYAATGKPPSGQLGVSTIASEWREYYAENNEQYEIKEIEI
jgi:hypothetical protein